MAVREVLVGAERLALIAFGGFVGANSRFFIDGFQPGLTGTFIANVTGSFLLGFIVYESIRTDFLSDRGRFVLSTGFLSSYTTYSTFALETAETLPLIGIANIAASYSFGIIGVLAGRALADRIPMRNND